MAKQTKKEVVKLVVRDPGMQTVTATIEGTSIMKQNRFRRKAMEEMMRKMAQGGAAKSSSKREPRTKADFEKESKDASHISTAGWYGLPAPALRSAMISACRAQGIVMTRAKLAVHVLEDGYDKADSTPLVKITKGKPKATIDPVPNANGNYDLRARPEWKPGWQAVVNIRFDPGMIDAESVVNLLARAGQQVGIGPGRPDSTNSCGLGWGLFKVLGSKGRKVAA